ncbi:MAG: hypothetical protein VXY91_06180 [Bacteroidota bacterium]|nr:hypothetical protein [Bacteroidota bacterium]
MFSVVAALFALIGGAVVAAYLYYRRGVKFSWDLAILRCIWFSFLIYAILSPPAERVIEDKIKPHLTVLVDTTASLGIDKDSLMIHASEPFSSLGYHVDIKGYSENNIPSQTSWAYVGDGHISSVPGINTPQYFSLQPSKELQPISLIQGIVVPPRVLKGSSMNIRILAHPECEVVIKFNGVKHADRIWTTNAPLNPGYFSVKVEARLNERIEELETTIEVSRSLATILIVRNAPHPHEGMVRRICKAKGIAVQTVNWNELSNIRNFSGPIITLGGREAALTALIQRSKVPLLHLDIAGANSYPKKDVYSNSIFDSSLKVYYRKSLPSIKVGEQSIDARGIHWYKSALDNANSLIAFEQLVKILLQRYDPVQLVLTLPQQAQMRERILVSAAAVNGRSEAIPSTISGFVRLHDKIIEKLTFKSDGLSMICSFIPRVPGQYEVVTEGTTEFGPIAAKSIVQVNTLDIELVRRFYNTQFNFWKSNGAQELDSVEQKVLPIEISYKKETPQHLYWWYWGITLFAAAAEWIIRRSRGLV